MYDKVVARQMVLRVTHFRVRYFFDVSKLTCLLQIPSYLRNYATQVPDIGDSLCAVVDFDGSDAALKAVRELKEKYNDTGMRLALLGNYEDRRRNS